MLRLARGDAKKSTEAAVPLGRYGSVKEIADATIYIFSDSGNFVNASTVVGTYHTAFCPILATCTDRPLDSRWRSMAFTSGRNIREWLLLSRLSPVGDGSHRRFRAEES